MLLHELQNIFTYHSPKPGQPELYAALRSKALELAILINESCPESREKDESLKGLETAIFYANASIARHGQ